MTKKKKPDYFLYNFESELREQEKLGAIDKLGFVDLPEIRTIMTDFKESDKQCVVFKCKYISDSASSANYHWNVNNAKSIYIKYFGEQIQCQKVGLCLLTNIKEYTNEDSMWLLETNEENTSYIRDFQDLCKLLYIKKYYKENKQELPMYIKHELGNLNNKFFGD